MRPVLEKAGPTRGGKEVLEQRCELETASESYLRMFPVYGLSEVSGLTF